jgi:uncharacterized protein YllA (UPF0747 family)
LTNDYLENYLQSYTTDFQNLRTLKTNPRKAGKLQWNDTHSKILVCCFKKQYSKVETSVLTKQNIEALNNPNTFTVTTGHQLNLFSGPYIFV